MGNKASHSESEEPTSFLAAASSTKQRPGSSSAHKTSTGSHSHIEGNKYSFKLSPEIRCSSEDLSRHKGQIFKQADISELKDTLSFPFRPRRGRRRRPHGGRAAADAAHFDEHAQSRQQQFGAQCRWPGCQFFK